MKNLGKIFSILFLIPTAMFASVVASLDSKSIELGEMVTYSLTITGENIQRPLINSLCATDVISTSSQTNIQMLNGEYRKSYVLSYKFLPQKSCEIKPIEVEIDGNTEVSNGVKLEVKAVSAAKDSNFKLTLLSDANEVFVGESFKITLIFKQKRNAEAVDSKFIAPELKGFWIKNESQPTREQDGEYTITKLSYTMAAQRTGDLKVTPAQMRIALRSNARDVWGSWIPKIKWKTYFSNELNIKVKPLPAGVDLVGNFSIMAVADKKKINANEAVNVTLEVLGDGNLEDIKSFKPFVDGVSVFDEKIVLKGTKLTQKMAFVADSDFTIPVFSLRYFDPQTKEIKTISTNEIAISVKGAKPQEELTIKREEITKEVPTVSSSNGEFSLLLMIVTFVVGLAFGILLMLTKPWKKFSKEKAISIKDPKVLLVKLLPFKDDEEVQKIVDILEKNIYSGENIEIEKKLLKEIVKKYLS